MNSFQNAQAEARGPSPVPGFDKKLDEINTEIKYDKKGKSRGTRAFASSYFLSTKN